MADARLEGRRAFLVGEAEPTLVQATEAALRAAGAEVERIADQAMASGDPPHICVCFARTPSGRPLARMDSDELAVSVEEALLRPQRLISAAARRMAEGSGGVIVVVGSVDTTHAYPSRAAASIAMGGLLGLVRSIAVELSTVGVRANLVIAGPLDTDAGEVDEARLERTLTRSPSHRLGRPQEIAAAVCFVAGPDAGFMTGQTMRVDGGWGSLNQAPDGMRFR